MFIHVSRHRHGAKTRASADCENRRCDVRRGGAQPWARRPTMHDTIHTRAESLAARRARCSYRDVRGGGDRLGRWRLRRAVRWQMRGARYPSYRVSAGPRPAYRPASAGTGVTSPPRRTARSAHRKARVYQRGMDGPRRDRARGCCGLIDAAYVIEDLHSTRHRRANPDEDGVLKSVRCGGIQEIHWASKVIDAFSKVSGVARLGNATIDHPHLRLAHRIPGRAEGAD
ncbi:hypothetical protein CBM2589_B130054 [Cupriavidus taiwanensis]|uniref:Uncharacterized protein n=1 Tax=Cupriavidus taiwanensis TaxID=164546 RepID=A0A375BIB6_9BURK|nr:hypothetical protein CBM2589_B130054 [Cupriavidus taiwanensis]